MFVIRQATNDDLPTLLKLAKMVHFINLPADRDIIAAKIVRSRRSFAGQAESEREREFMFVLEDTESASVVGTSAVLSCVSWPGHPHTYLKVRKRNLFSNDLQSGAVHITLELGTDETGPSEIGGLILAPGYRGHKGRLGSLLSQIRFHYMSLHREWFAERVIAEMMGALTPDSRNLLWEYLGRRFINLQYAEADRFCQHSKEFITSLFPPGEIWACLLPPEARNLIGRVGEETRPALALLKAQGFNSEEHIDPFDGGPYLSARRDEIPVVAATVRGTMAIRAGLPATDEAYLSADDEDGFRAVRAPALLEGDTVYVDPAVASVLRVQPGDALGVTPLPRRAADGSGGSAGGRSRGAAGTDGAAGASRTALGAGAASTRPRRGEGRNSA